MSATQPGYKNGTEVSAVTENTSVALLPDALVCESTTSISVVALIGAICKDSVVKIFSFLLYEVFAKSLLCFIRVCPEVSFAFELELYP